LGSASATPLFGIHTLEEWKEALGGGGGGGRIVPVEADEFRAMVRGDDQWPVEYQEAKFFTPHLYPEMHTDSQGREEAGLVMHWGDADMGATTQPPPELGDRVAAAWDYVYPEDPDLNGTALSFSIHGPWESTYVSLNILDTSGNYREWIWHVGFQPGEIPPCVWSTVTVDPVNLTSNYTPVPGTPFVHGAAFDLTSIKYIRFNENGIWSPEFQDPVTGLVWNAWNHVEVTPEPGTMILLGGGLLGLLARRRRKK